MSIHSAAEVSGRLRRPAAAERQRHWALFTDFCAATGQIPLPASPATLAAFRAEIIAGPATIARRVRAIDAAHTAAGFPAPAKTAKLVASPGCLPPPRFDQDLVARALEVIPVGGWPVGIVGRRDAAIVALVCTGGLTRAEVHALRTDATPTPLLAGIPKTEAPGPCPACALSRWLRVANDLERCGWLAVRAVLSDYGEVPAGDEASHDCARSLTTIAASRLAVVQKAEADPEPSLPPGERVGDHPGVSDTSGGSSSAGSPTSASDSCRSSSTKPRSRRRWCSPECTKPPKLTPVREHFAVPNRASDTSHG